MADPLAALREPAPGAFDRIRSRLHRIPPEARPWAIGLAAACAALVVVAGLWAARSMSAPGGAAGAGADPLAALPYAGTTGAITATTETRELVVHAAGAVADPGLHRLPAGARVGDLVDAAGGLAPDADADRVNLAAPLADGARVYVPHLGELVVPVVAGDGGPAPDGATPAEPAAVDLNRATAEQLEVLPGVGPTIAAAIVEHRARNGPFGSVDELVEVRGIGAARLEQLRPLVRV